MIPGGRLYLGVTALTSIFVPVGTFHDAVPFRGSAHMGRSDRNR